MPSVLCLTVRFLDPVPTFHGKGDNGEPEWPPSPLRLFQALVAASARRWPDSPLPDSVSTALQWFEQLNKPIVVEPGIQSQRVGFRMYVPNNAGDLVTMAWARGNDDFKFSSLNEGKDVLPSRLLHSDTIQFLYPLPNSDCPHLKTLLSATRSITHLGWGINMVACNLEIISQESADKLTGNRWVPVEGASKGYRVPISGTLESLLIKHKAFLSRLDLGGFKPVPPLTTFQIIGYRKSTDPISRPFLAFSILKPDASGFRAFDTLRKTRNVAAMTRAAIANTAAQFGWPIDRINSFIHGHGNSKSGQSTSDDRLMFLPLPSITPLKVDNIRRILIVVPQGCSTKELQNITNGIELIPEGSNEPIAILSLIPKSDKTIGNYWKPTCTWSTITPVLLPGYDDPGHLRKKLQNNSDPLLKKKIIDKLNARVLHLLQKAFIQAGFSQELVNQIQFDWRSVGFRAGVDLASKYVTPENLKKFPAYHVFVRFPDKFQGPLAIGAGRYRGFGLFASHND